MRGASWFVRFAVVALVIAVWIGLFGWPGDPAEGGAKDPGAKRVAAPAAPALPSGVQQPRITEDHVRPAPAPVDRMTGEAGYVELPNGSFLPALNGVLSRDALQWSGAFPPVTGILRNAADGLEWYVLENGDVLTTVNAPGTENGRPVLRDLILHVQRKDVLPVVGASGR